uniref:Transposase, Ptta/En/Spm, transposase, Tnp1/En/Spm-like protein n=1 Tax=Tanacetum cinerariifolium TaxID=118510 RepID=A0A6L2K4X4_TANCI|nr:transposase, Ptta/En/Spm, transposase, Tnp1/En/Spm-like protein [Tanacetum cinerariifolium]
MNDDFPPISRNKVTQVLEVVPFEEQADELIKKLAKNNEAKMEKVKSIALKAKKESSDDEISTSRSDDEEYAMAVRKFKKFFRMRDVVIQIISLANVQSLYDTKIKRRPLDVVGAIAKMKRRTKSTMKIVSWLNRQMR